MGTFKQVKQVTVDAIDFDSTTGARSGDMRAVATLRLGTGSYSYLTINAVISDELKLRIIGLIEKELAEQLDAVPGTKPKSPAHKVPSTEEYFA